MTGGTGLRPLGHGSRTTSRQGVQEAGRTGVLLRLVTHPSITILRVEQVRGLAQWQLLSGSSDLIFGWLIPYSSVRSFLCIEMWNPSYWDIKPLSFYFVPREYPFRYWNSIIYLSRRLFWSLSSFFFLRLDMGLSGMYRARPWGSRTRVMANPVFKQSRGS